jgi:GNAT superfamily N-acetyltransferase
MSMHPEIHIRRAEVQDAATVSRILHESFVEFEPLYTAGGFAATTPTEEQVLDRMIEGPVWITFRHDDALGTVAAIVKGESIYMRGMAVLPSARKLGVAARLIETVEQWVAIQGSSRVFLTTTPFLHDAIRLYEKHGFCRVQDGEKDLFGTPLFTMEKALSRVT